MIKAANLGHIQSVINVDLVEQKHCRILNSSPTFYMSFTYSF